MSYYCYYKKPNFANLIRGNSTNEKETYITTYPEVNEPDELTVSRFMTYTLTSFLHMYQDLYLTNKHDLYYTFKIPKASGGWRQITAPHPRPAQMFTELKNQMQRGFLCSYERPFYHNNAFAYMEKRWVKLAAARHQKNQSEYFLKLDIHDFFGSTTKEFAMRMIKQVEPFATYCKSPDSEELLAKVLDICFLDDGLPQGTQISPLLTNIIMLPFDYLLSNKLPDKYVYTRYADDMYFSCKEDFDWHEIYNYVIDLWHELDAPYTMNTKKIKYVHNKGQSNWILGVQLNDRNDLTIGRKRKREIRWLLHYFFQDPEAYSLKNLQEMAGKIVWFQNVEPEVYRETMKYYNRKYGCDVMQVIYTKISEKNR